MNDLKNAKNLGGIGSILILVGLIVPYAGLLVALIGFILVVIGIYNISKITKDDSIFKNYLFSFILQIVAMVAVFAIFIVTFKMSLSLSIAELIELAQSETQITDPSQIFSNIEAFLGGCCLALIVGWILTLLSAIFLKNSFESIKEKTKVDLFGTTGLLYLIGAGLIIIGVGAIILCIALILQIVAFFQLPDQLKSAKPNI